MNALPIKEEKNETGFGKYPAGNLRFAFFSVDAHGLPVAWRLAQEGNEVYVGFVQEYADIGMKRKETPEEKRRRLLLFDGMFENRTDSDSLLDFLAAIPKSDRDSWFVVCDFNYLWPIADKVKALGGYKGLLPTKEDHSFEEDRQKAKEFFKKNYPIFSDMETQEFKIVDDAIDFLSESEQQFVVKGFDEEAPTVVPEDTDPGHNHEQLIDVMLKNREIYEKKGFLLEEKISDIIEFTPEATWFDGECLGVSIDIEAKGLGSGDSGHQTGCSLDTVFWLDDYEEIYKNFLKPLEKMMSRKGELTIGDASVLYSPSRRKFYPGEFCFNRWGFNAIFTELSTFESATDYFERIVSKKPLYDEQVLQFGASIRVFNLVPDPKEHELQVGGGLMLMDDNAAIWPWDVYCDEEGTYRNVGKDKNLAIVTGAGSTLSDAVDDAYDNEVDFSWTRKYTRAKHDFLSEEYATSIVHRFKILNHFVFDVPDIRHIDKKDPEMKTAIGRSPLPVYTGR